MKNCEKNTIFATSEIELDESYFIASRVKDKRGAKDKIPVFEILKRDDKIL